MSNLHDQRYLEVNSWRVRWGFQKHSVPDLCQRYDIVNKNIVVIVAGILEERKYGSILTVLNSSLRLVRKLYKQEAF